MLESIGDVLPAIISSFVSFMFLRSSGLLGKKEENKKETSFKPQNEADKVHIFLEQVAKGNFEVKENDDLTFRRISVKGLEDIELIWMGMWSKEDTFIIQKSHSKRYMYYTYEGKSQKIKNLNDSFIVDELFVQNSGLFDREWTAVEAQHVMMASQMVSEFCRGELNFEKQKKERATTHAKNLESRCQEIKSLSYTTKEGIVKNKNVPSICQNIWQRIEEEAEKIIAQHELSIEEQHNIERWLNQGNQLILQYQQLAPAQRQQEEKEIQVYLHKILHTLEALQTEKMEIVYQEFEKTKRIIQETH